MKFIVEPITYHHLIEARDLGWGGWEKWGDAYLRYLPMVGYAARSSDGALIGVGCVVWIGKPSTGRAIGCFAITEEFRANPRSRWVHRLAIEVLELAHEATPVIYADVDKDIPNAVEFLARLGFVEENGEWIKRHGIYDSRSSGSRIFRSLERDGDPERGGRDHGGGRPV